MTNEELLAMVKAVSNAQKLNGEITLLKQNIAHLETKDIEIHLSDRIDSKIPVEEDVVKTTRSLLLSMYSRQLNEKEEAFRNLKFPQ